MATKVLLAQLKSDSSEAKALLRQHWSARDTLYAIVCSCVRV